MYSIEINGSTMVVSPMHQFYRDNPFDHKILKADLHIYLESDADLIKAKTKG